MPEMFDGKFLTPHFTWVLGGVTPNAGYSVDPAHRLYRNGEFVGVVTLIEWDMKMGTYWVHYRAQRGSPMDMGHDELRELADLEQSSTSEEA